MLPGWRGGIYTKGRLHPHSPLTFTWVGKDEVENLHSFDILISIHDEAGCADIGLVLLGARDIPGPG